MILPIAFLLGFLFGWVRAAKRGGQRLDKLQYGATHGIAFMLLALLTTFALRWSGIL